MLEESLSFTSITTQLQTQLKSNLPQIMMLLQNNPAMAYTKITEIGLDVGKKYNIQLLVNFPQENKINEFDFYGKRDLSIIVDRQKRNFAIPRQTIKDVAAKTFGSAKIDDAYMYEGKEGVKVVMPDGGRIEILPGSVHLWCRVDEKIRVYADWLMQNVYFPHDSI